MRQMGATGVRQMEASAAGQIVVIGNQHRIKATAACEKVATAA